MSKKVIYISDYFIDECPGGAEISDSVLIDFLRENKVSVQKIKCSNFNMHHADTYIISNFHRLSRKNKNFLIKESVDYIIIERDQKYVRSRNTAEYPNFIAPPSEVVNKDFYAAAKTVFCLTSKQMEIMKEHINLNNIKSLGCTQFSKEQMRILSENIDNEKNNKYAVVRGKRSDKAMAICNKNNLDFDVIENNDYKGFIQSLSKYHGIVFFSHAFESCCRLLIEARVLNLSIITDNRNGCTYEPWFKENKGRDLLDFLEKKTEETMMKVLKDITDHKQKCSP